MRKRPQKITQREEHVQQDGGIMGERKHGNLK